MFLGYGDSSGSPSEEGVVADALHTYKWVKENCGSSPVFLWGHSLGTGYGHQFMSIYYTFLFV